jgi:hypothetical protein
VNNPPSLSASPDQDFLKLLDALDPWLLHERRCGAEAGDESKCDCGISAARQSLVDYVEGIRAERDRLNRRLDEWQESEASVCPEDWGFVEYIKQLEKSFNRTAKELLDAQAELSALKEDARTGKSSLTVVPGKKAHHAWVTDECRSNRGDAGAGKEAADRLIEEYRECLRAGWPSGTRFHFVLTVERGGE